MPGLAFEWYEPERQAALCELLLNTTEHPGEGISVSLTYAAELFDEASIAQLARHYVNVLQSIVDQPECRVRDIALLDERDGAVRHARQLAAAVTSQISSRIDASKSTHACTRARQQ